MSTELVPYQQQLQDNNSLNLKAVIISAALSFCCYKWFVSVSLLFLSPLFALLFLNYRKEFFVACGLLLGGELVCIFGECLVAGLFSWRAFANSFGLLLALLVPVVLFFCVVQLRLRYALLLCGSCAGILLAFFVLTTGFSDIFISALHELAKETSDTAGMLFTDVAPETNADISAGSMLSAEYFSEKNVFDLLLTVTQRMWIFAFVFFYSVNVFVAHLFCRWRCRNEQRVSVFVQFINDRWCSICLSVFVVLCVVGQSVMPQSHLTIAVWNAALVFSIPAAMAGISVSLRALRRLRPAARIAVVFGCFMILSMFVSFLGGIVYCFVAVAGIVDSWIPLFRPVRIFADPTPGDGKESCSSQE